MKMKIEVYKGFITLNSYSVYGEKGSCMFRTGSKHGFSTGLRYVVTGQVNGHFVAVSLNAYTQARQLFDAMEDR